MLGLEHRISTGLAIIFDPIFPPHDTAMALFQSPDRLSSTNGGSVSFTVVEQPPDQGSVTGFPGKTGSAQGDTIFTVRTDPRFIIFSECYFRVQGHFTNAAETKALPNIGTSANPQLITVCDNWPAALFQTCRVTLNGSQIEQCLNVPQTDTIATYSAATKSWLESYGSASGVGESLQNRVIAAGAQPRGSTVAGNWGFLTATFRPPLSIFNCATAIRGNQWRFILSWNPSAEQQVCESAGIDQTAAGSGGPLPAIAVTDYRFKVDSLTLFVATVAPDPSVPIPRRVLIDLTPCQTTYQGLTIVTGSYNISVPPTTFRIAVAFQDANDEKNAVTTAWAPAHGANGIFPITNFTLGLSAGANNASNVLVGAPAWLKNFRISSSQLGLSIPIPDYAFNAVAGAGTVTSIMSRAGIERAYRDFIQTTQGDSSLSEGAIPFGCLDSAAPLNVFTMGVAPVVANISALGTGDGSAGFPRAQVSFADPFNPNAVGYVNPTTYAPGAFTALNGQGPYFDNGAQANTLPSNQVTAMYGWLGRYGILAFPIVKPVGTNLSQLDFTIGFTTGPKSGVAFICAYYGAAVCIDYNQDGSVSRVEVQQNN